jgi:hypothetical protein
VPFVPDEQVLIGRKCLKTFSEAPDKVFRLTSRGLARDPAAVWRGIRMSAMGKLRRPRVRTRGFDKVICQRCPPGCSREADIGSQSDSAASRQKGSKALKIGSRHRGLEPHDSGPRGPRHFVNALQPSSAGDGRPDREHVAHDKALRRTVRHTNEDPINNYESTHLDRQVKRGDD